MASRQLLVSGRVQQVGYRAFIYVRGTRWRLTGTVRNLPDGSVEILASGTEDSLALLEQAAWQGPPLAQVSDIVATELGERAWCGFAVLA